MTWFGELRRRLSALFGWLRRPGQGAAAQLSLPPAPVVPAAPAALRTTVPSESPGSGAGGVRAAESVVAGQSASQSAAVSVSAGSVAAGSVAGASVAAASVVVASVAPVAVKRAAPAQPEGPKLDPSLGQLKARQFFARMIAATPAGLTIDFAEWQSASVERFFMAMTSPGLTRRREAPTSGVEQVSLTNAFQGFEWD